MANLVDLREQTLWRGSPKASHLKIHLRAMGKILYWECGGQWVLSRLEEILQGNTFVKRILLYKNVEAF